MRARQGADKKRPNPPAAACTNLDNPKGVAFQRRGRGRGSIGERGMKFGKEFRNHLEETLPEWRDKLLCYKPLKKLIKHRITLLLDPLSDDYPEAPLAPGPWAGLEDWFLRILDEELDKFNDLYVDKEEEFIIRLQELKERIEELREIKSEDSTSRSVSSEEMMEIRKAFVTIHGEMVLLKNYSSLNFAGLVKILKKYDKRTGALLSLPFTRRALHQPFFTTEPLTGLVRECESNMELLFPLEAEVIESASHENMRRCPNTSKPNVASAQEDKSDLYRSTMAAMKAIRSLRKASSTYNPLSLAQFFHAQDDDDGSGVVTAEDSGSDSHTTSQYKEADQENVHSND